MWCYLDSCRAIYKNNLYILPHRLLSLSQMLLSFPFSTFIDPIHLCLWKGFSALMTLLIIGSYFQENFFQVSHLALTFQWASAAVPQSGVRYVPAVCLQCQPQAVSASCSLKDPTSSSALLLFPRLLPPAQSEPQYAWRVCFSTLLLHIGAGSEFSQFSCPPLAVGKHCLTS